MSGKISKRVQKNIVEKQCVMVIKHLNGHMVSRAYMENGQYILKTRYGGAWNPNDKERYDDLGEFCDAMRAIDNLSKWEVRGY